MSQILEYPRDLSPWCEAFEAHQAPWRSESFAEDLADAAEPASPASLWLAAGTAALVTCGSMALLFAVPL